MNQRFSKAALADHVFAVIDGIQKKYHFNPNNGWNQVDGKGEESNRAYSEFAAMMNLVSIYGLVHPEDRKS